MTSDAARLEDWRLRFHMEDQFGRVVPNRGYKAIAHLVAAGKCSAVITQNIDRLHQESGIPDDRVIEIHGDARHAVCTGCGQRHEVAQCRGMFERTGKPPACRQCGGIVKSAVMIG